MGVLSDGREGAEERRQGGEEGLGHRCGGSHLLAHHAVEPGHGLGGLGIGGHRRPLLLPQVQIAAREILEFGRFGHGAAV